MSLSIGHFAVGTSCTMIIFHTLPLRIRLKMRIAQPLIFISGGLWAMLPDLAHISNSVSYLNDKYLMNIGLLHGVRTSIIHSVTDLLQAFHISPWANICFFHQLMDTWDKRDSPLISAVFVCAMVLIALATFVRDLIEQQSRKR